MAVTVLDDILVAVFALGQRHGDPVIEPYRPGAIYPIDDLNPCVCIGFPGTVSAKLKERVGVLARADGLSPDRTWWRWQPIASDDKGIGKSRRYGHYRAELDRPRGVTLECYLWPGLFFDAQAYQTMLRDIANEIGEPIEWEPSTVPVRAQVVTSRGRPTDSEQLGVVAAELRAAQLLERAGVLADQYSEHAQLGASADSPEARLLAMWAWRRLADLVEMQRRQTQIARSYEATARDPNKARAELHRLHAEAALALGSAVSRQRVQVSRIAQQRRHELSAFDLSPAMQRDHRLRRLVRAFAPATREHWAAVPTTQLSTLPPLKAPDVFELWSLARLLAAIAALGWTLRESSCSTANGWLARSSRRWTFSRDNLVLTVEHNPPVAVLDCRSAPEMHVRRMPLIEWAATHVPGPDGLIATADLTPDYGLKLATASGMPLAMAIGDATLSDPRHAGDREGRGEGTRTKPDKLVGYRERIAWRANGRVIRASPAGTFIVLPGPPARWEAADNLLGADSVLLFPVPGVAIEEDSELRARVAAMLDTMSATSA